MVKFADLKISDTIYYICNDKVVPCNIIGIWPEYDSVVCRGNFGVYEDRIEFKHIDDKIYTDVIYKTFKEAKQALKKKNKN